MIACAGCGLGLFKDDRGGADHLPTQGTGPYDKTDIDFDTPADEPYVLADSQASLVDPSVLRRDDDGFRIWFGREHDDDQPGESQIWYAEIPTIQDLPDVRPELAVAADAPWEQGRVAEPSVIELENGNLIMFYSGGIDAPGLGRADSTDGGQSFTKHADNPIATGVTDPAVVLFEGHWLLFANRAQPGIWRATSDDGVNWTFGAAPVVVPRPQLPDAFDTGAVFNPFVIATITAAGQTHYGMFFNGSRPSGDIAIGYAGSWNSVSWDRFGGEDPILSSGPPEEFAPSAVLETTRGILFFTQERNLRQRIAVALNP